MTISLGVATGVPAPELTGTLARPGAQPVAVADGQEVTITEDDLGGALVLDVLASNSQGDEPEAVTLQIPAVAAPITITAAQPTAQRVYQRFTDTGGAYSLGEGPVAIGITVDEAVSSLLA